MFYSAKVAEHSSSNKMTAASLVIMLKLGPNLFEVVGIYSNSTVCRMILHHMKRSCLVIGRIGWAMTL